MPPSVRGRASSVWQAYCINSINRRGEVREGIVSYALPLDGERPLEVPALVVVNFLPRPLPTHRPMYVRVCVCPSADTSVGKGLGRKFTTTQTSWQNLQADYL